MASFVFGVTHLGEIHGVGDGLYKFKLAVVNGDGVSVEHVLRKKEAFARMYDRFWGHLSPDGFFER